MTCTGRYATALQYAQFFCLRTPLGAVEQAAIEAALDMSAGRIHMARASVGACDCTLSVEAAYALMQLNCILAAVFFNCPCGDANLSDERRSLYMQDAQATLTAIVDGRLEVCAGETGSEFPAIGSAEQTWTPWRAEEIIRDTSLRNP